MSPARTRGWRGYISSRPQGAGFVPQRVQNLVIRDYAARHQLLFLLSAVEYTMDGCSMMLRALIDEADHLDGLLFYSTHLLPDDAAVREQLWRLVRAGDFSVRFALEELTASDERDISMMEDLLLVRQITKNHTGINKIEG